MYFMGAGKFVVMDAIPRVDVASIMTRLSGGTPKVQAQAAREVCLASREQATKLAFARAGAIPLLVKLLGDGTSSGKA